MTDAEYIDPAAPKIKRPTSYAADEVAALLRADVERVTAWAETHGADEWLLTAAQVAQLAKDLRAGACGPVRPYRADEAQEIA
jgi:class 3 adenylate cyclase